VSEIPEVIGRYISSYNDLDVAGMLRCLSDDIEFQNISDGKLDTDIKSKVDFENLAKMGVLAFLSRKQTVRKFITVSNLTLVQIDYQAIVANDLPNGWKAGQQLDFSGASAFELKDGYISKIIDQS